MMLIDLSMPHTLTLDPLCVSGCLSLAGVLVFGSLWRFGQRWFPVAHRWFSLLEPSMRSSRTSVQPQLQYASAANTLQRSASPPVLSLPQAHSLSQHSLHNHAHDLGGAGSPLLRPTPPHIIASSGGGLPPQGPGGIRPPRGCHDPMMRHASPYDRPHPQALPASGRHYPGVMTELSVLFADIRNYSNWVATSPPEIVMMQLNQYFGAMAQVIFRFKGRLDKYMGDGLMATFEAPDGNTQNGAMHACFSALDMMSALDQLNQEWLAQGLPTLSIGIGICTGPVYMGSIGSNMKVDLTVIGHTVNMAARLEELNKLFHSQILLCDVTGDAVQQAVPLDSMGKVTLRGSKEPIRVFQISSENITKHATMHQQARQYWREAYGQ